MSGVIRRRLRLYGAVQGVGLRWRALHAANLTGATGWIQNEYDGSVTLEIQAPEEGIDRMLAILQRGPYVSIDFMDAKTLPCLEDERGFRVREDG